MDRLGLCVLALWTPFGPGELELGASRPGAVAGDFPSYALSFTAFSSGLQRDAGHGLDPQKLLHEWMEQNGWMDG